MEEKVRQKLIISADDFGIRDVASAILPLAYKKKLDRVSVLVNYIRSSEEVEALKASGVKIDLHLEAIKLIRSGDRVRESALLRGFNFLIRYGLGLVTEARIEAEWVAQIERFKEWFGRYPDGLNSHEHVHYFPRFFKVFVRLGERYDISFLRCGKKGILLPSSTLTARVLALLWKKNQLKIHALQNFTSSDFVVSFDWVDNFSRFADMLPGGVTEVVFHPERPEEYGALMKFL